MDISCDIIRDLLPLYAEDLVSEDSRILVGTHLQGCAACGAYLEELKSDTPISAEVDIAPLKKVRNTIVRRRALSVMASVMTLLTVAGFVLSYLFAPFQLTVEQALDDFYVREDGAIVIDYSAYVTGRSQSGINDNWFINQYSTRYDMWKGDNRRTIEEVFGADGVITGEERQRYENIDIIYGRYISADGKTTSDSPIPWEENGGRIEKLESEKNWWYSDPTGLGEDVLLHDAGAAFPDKEDRIQFAPVYPVLFFGGILIVLVLLFLRRFLKNAWLKELAARGMILMGSIVISTMFVSGGRIFTSYVGVINQYWGSMIGTIAVFLTLSILFWRQLYLLNKQDKGE